MLCCSGTIAVELALRGLGVTASDEVLLSGYDFPGNFRAIENIGAIPVLADLTKNHWTVDVASLAAAVGPKTVAAIVSHLHGSLAPMPEIRQWADDTGITLVEDTCQSPGGRIDGQLAGTFGDASVLSFGGSKPLTAGRGGAILTDKRQVLQRIRVHSERGNHAFPMSELQAAVLRPQLARLDIDNQLRQTRATQLIAALTEVPGLTPLEILPSWNPNAIYKLGWWYDAAEKSRRSRDQAAYEFWCEGIPIDAGFRGFVGRSAKLCRQPTRLTRCRAAIDQTLILHHPVLLEPADRIEQLATAIRNLF